jgi:hypothetical protein
MKASRLTLLLFLLIPMAARAQSSDEQAVRKAILNYVEGFYEGDSTKIAQGVFSGVNKRGFYIPQGSATGEYVMSPMTFEQMFEYTRAVRASGRTTDASAPKEIQVYEVLDQTASAKLTASWGTDYLLLAKSDGVWKIWQVLWQTRPPK